MVDRVFVMRWIWKSAVVAAALALAATVGIREFRPSLFSEKTEAHQDGAHDAKSGGHDHGKEHAHEAARKSEEAAGKSDDGHDHGEEHAHEKVAKAEEPAGKSKDGHGHGAAQGHDEDQEGVIKLTASQLLAAGIETAVVVSGALVKEIAVPGRVSLNLEGQAKVVPKVSGTVNAVKKRLGESVTKGEVLATLESREMADAKAEYLEAWRAENLARTIYQREARLWKQKVTAEQEYLNAEAAYESAKIKLELAGQKLQTFGLADEDVKKLPKTKDDPSFRTYDIRSPISGQVTALELVLGQAVGTDKEIFTIADLSTVWVELAIQPADLAFAAVGQEVRIESNSRTATGKIVILSPVIDPDSRSAKAIAEIDNTKREWRLGDFVKAQLISGRIEANLVVPKDAIQTIKSQTAAFVSEEGGFKMRPVTVGREDSTRVEIVSGLEAGETVAVKNTFTLKAELGKAEAEHEH